MLAEMGALGIGFVWGWLINGPAGLPGRTLRTLVAISLATTLIGLQVLTLMNWKTSGVYLAAVLLAMGLRQTWRHALNKRSATRSATGD